jgi:transcriptional regulator with XRE-family HTH domain
LFNRDPYPVKTLKAVPPRDDAPATTNPSPELGDTVRRLRKQKSMSLQDLATASGVSMGMLSQVERGLSNPSVRVMTSIRRALGAGFGDIFGEESRRLADPAFVHRKLGRPRLQFAQLSKELLSSGTRHNLQFMILHIEPGGSSGDTALSYAAEKGGLVLSGSLLLRVGNEESLLLEGDSFVFDSAIPHSFRNPGQTEAQVLWIIGAVALDRHL